MENELILKINLNYCFITSALCLETMILVHSVVVKFYPWFKYISIVLNSLSYLTLPDNNMMIKFKPRIYLNQDIVLVSEAILKDFFFLWRFLLQLKKDRVELILMRN